MHMHGYKIARGTPTRSRDAKRPVTRQGRAFDVNLSWGAGRRDSEREESPAARVERCREKDEEKERERERVFFAAAAAVDPLWAPGGRDRKSNGRGPPFVHTREFRVRGVVSRERERTVIWAENWVKGWLSRECARAHRVR